MTEKLHRLDIGDALRNEPEPLDFTLPGLIAGSVGMLASPGGTGKSFLVQQIAASITAGIPLAGGAWPAPKATGRVVVLAGEDSPHLLRHRWHAIGRMLAREVDFPAVAEAVTERVDVYPLAGTIPTVQCDGGFPGSFFDQLQELAKGARLLVLDPIRRFTEAEENDSGAMTRLMQLLEVVCRETGTTILFTHHSAKAPTLNGQGDLQQAARGSSALVDGCRWMAFLAGMTQQEARGYEGIDPEAEEHRHFVRLGVSKVNGGPPQADVWLRRLSGGPLTHTQLIASGEARHASAV